MSGLEPYNISASPSEVTGLVNNNFAAAPDDASMSMVLDVPKVLDLIMILPPKSVTVAPVIEPIAVIQLATVSQFAVKVFAIAVAPSTETFRT